VPSNDGKAGLECVMRTTAINKLIFVETLNSGQTLIHIVTPVFENLSHYERTYTSFQEDSAKIMPQQILCFPKCIHYETQLQHSVYRKYCRYKNITL
jgi:hypothetical protein